MHWYKRNLGDYAKKAGRLSMLQHGSYTLLIDACYDREQFPTHAEAIDWTWASSTAEVEAVEFVLAKFFTLEDGRYVQARIKDELLDYQEKATTNKRIADEREAKRAELRTKRARGVNEPPPNQEPVTSNQEPIKEKDKETPPAPNGADELEKKPFDQFWAIWLKTGKGNEKKKSQEVWKRKKLDALCDEICGDVSNRLLNHRSWREGFIPNPATYLRNERWNDQIDLTPPKEASNATNPKPSNSAVSKVRAACAEQLEQVKAWAASQPD